MSNKFFEKIFDKKNWETHLNFTHWAEFIIVWISWDHTHFVKFGFVTRAQLVKDMETSFSFQLESDTWLFEKVSVNVTRSKDTTSVEMNSDEFTETGWVIVSECLGVTEGFHSRVSGDNLVFKGHVLDRLGSRGINEGFGGTTSGDKGEVLDDLLCVDSLTSTRFT